MLYQYPLKLILGLKQRVWKSQYLRPKEDWVRLGCLNQKVKKEIKAEYTNELKKIKLLPENRTGHCSNGSSPWQQWKSLCEEDAGSLRRHALSQLSNIMGMGLWSGAA